MVTGRKDVVVTMFVEVVMEPDHRTARHVEYDMGGHVLEMPFAAMAGNVSSSTLVIAGLVEVQVCHCCLQGPRCRIGSHSVFDRSMRRRRRSLGASAYVLLEFQREHQPKT